MIDHCYLLISDFFIKIRMSSNNIFRKINSSVPISNIKFINNFTLTTYHLLLY